MIVVNCFFFIPSMGYKMGYTEKKQLMEASLHLQATSPKLAQNIEIQPTTRGALLREG